MTYEKFYLLLKSSGIPFAYHMWKSAPDLPFGVFRLVDETKFFADGAVYYSVKRFAVELYTDEKSPATEARMEQTLTRAGISFTKSESYIESERMFEILYECEV